MIRRLPLVTALVLALLATACAGAGRSSSTAASVGDAEISIERLEADILLFEFLTGLSGAPCGQPVGGESQDAACARFTLTNDIREEVAKAYAAEHDIAVEPDEVDQTLDQLEERLGGAEAFGTQLSDAGITRAQVEGLAFRLLLVNAVRDAVVLDRLGDEELRELYESELGSYTTIEVEHILVADAADARRIAAEVTPATFHRFAERESIDPGSASKGGNLGSFSETGFRAQFIPEFVEAALALEAGEITEPVRSEFGWHVIHLVRRDVAPFEDVVEQLRQQESDRVFQDWYFERLDATDVEVNPRFGRFDPETAQVLAVRSTENEPAAPTGATGATGAAGGSAAT